MLYPRLPLDKQPGARPIGIGEVLRSVIENIVMKIFKKDVPKATASLQLCARQYVGSEAAIHAVYEMFNKEKYRGSINGRCIKCFQCNKLGGISS